MTYEDDVKRVLTPFGSTIPQKPRNLRLETFPYLHLRDDDGCVLANDYVDHAKVMFILNCVNSSKLGDYRG